MKDATSPGRRAIEGSPSSDGQEAGDEQITAAGRIFILSSLALSAIAIVVLIPVLPAIEVHFSTTPHAPALVRALISSVSLAMIAGSLIAGFLADKFGIRPIIVGAMAIYAAAGISGYFIDNLVQLLVSRIAVGCAAATITLLTVALVASFEPIKRARWMGWISSIAIVGSLVIVPLAGLVGNLGWRYVFLLHAFAVPMLVLALIGIRTRKPERPATASIVAEPRTRLSWRVWTLAGLALLGGAAMNAVSMFMPFHLAQIGEELPSRISLAMLASTLAGAITSFAYGWSRRWASMSGLFALGYLMGGAGLLLVSQSLSFTPAIVGLCVAGLGFGFTVPNIYAMAAAVAAPGQNGRVLGVVKGCYAAGAPAAQVTIEMIAEGQPASTPLAIFAGIATFLGVAWFVLKGSYASANR